MAGTLLLHLGGSELGDVEEPADVDRNGIGVVVLRVLRERLGIEDAGVVDQRIDAAELRHAFADDPLGDFALGNVAGDRQDVGIVRRLDVAGVGDDPIAAVAERLDHAGTDALGGTGNDCDLA
ncbi:hypothetical protein D3C85_1609090 [compost metagenome]